MSVNVAFTPSQIDELDELLSLVSEAEAAGDENDEDVEHARRRVCEIMMEVL